MSNKNSWSEALKLARKGVPVFPCGPDKRPLISTGFKGATCESDRVHLWWGTEFPDALIGVPAGLKFVVIDLDLQHEDAQRWYDENRHRLPLTRTHATRSGGKHLLFAPNDQVRCTASKLGPRVDSRGAGGFIVWWPACGFEVLHGGVLAQVPAWIIETLNPKVIPITTRISATAYRSSTAATRRAPPARADAGG
jgi:hypothetical protein